MLYFAAWHNCWNFHAGTAMPVVCCLHAIPRPQIFMLSLAITLSVGEKKPSDVFAVSDLYLIPVTANLEATAEAA